MMSSGMMMGFHKTIARGCVDRARVKGGELWPNVSAELLAWATGHLASGSDPGHIARLLFEAAAEAKNMCLRIAVGTEPEPAAPAGIICHTCGLVSHSPDDVRNLWCGRCCKSHTDPSQYTLLRPR
jgi:hypothetical protein